jgi:integrase
MYVRFPQFSPATSDPASDPALYEADCLAGRRFPIVTDSAMQQRCLQAWRLREWFEIFKRYHLATVKMRSTRVARIRRYMKDLEDLDPNTVTRRTLTPWFQCLGTRSHVLANTALSELKLVYNKMIEYGWHDGHNPVVGMKCFSRNKHRKRFVHLDELKALLASIAEEPKPFQLIFLLSLNVGCRPGEAVQMKWTDLKVWQEQEERTGQPIWRGRWTKPTTKTDQSHTVPVPSQLVERFLALDHAAEWVFPGEQTHCRRAKPGPVSYSTVWKAWVRIRQRIGLGDVHIYDLRRSCATYLVNRGTNIALVSKGVLNHTNMQHTGVYTQTMTEPVQAALEEHANFVMSGGRADRPAPPVRQLPPPLVMPEAVRPDSGAREMDWPG